MNKRKYFENNWEGIKKVPSKQFRQVSFERVMAREWSLPSSTCCVIRVQDLHTKKVTEHTYRRRYAADRKLRSLTQEENKEITLLTDESMHILRPNLSDEDYDRMTEDDPEFQDIDMSADLNDIYGHLSRLNAELDEDEEDEEDDGITRV